MGLDYNQSYFRYVTANQLKVIAFNVLYGLAFKVESIYTQESKGVVR